MATYPINWVSESTPLLLSADRTLASALSSILTHDGDWVVIVRYVTFQYYPFFYVFRAAEIRALDGDTSASLEIALNLHESDASKHIIGPRPTALDEKPCRGSLSSGRVVHLDEDLVPLAVGVVATTDYPGRPSRTRGRPRVAPEDLDLGPIRGISGDESSRRPPSETSDRAPLSTGIIGDNQIAATLSAQAPQEVAVGRIALIDVKAEVAAESTPYAFNVGVTIREVEKIRVLLLLQHGTVEVMGERQLELDVPRIGFPSESAFEVRGTSPGSSRVALIFRQGSTELGSVALTIQVVTANPSAKVVDASTAAIPRNNADDEVIWLLVDQVPSERSLCYQYRLISPSLGLGSELVEFRSRPIQSSVGGPVATQENYVRSIYSDLTRVLRNTDDVRNFQRDLRGIATEMCGMLFPDELVRLLWSARDRLAVIKVASWEPYIPWEILMLKDPDTGAADDCFFGEYGLVRQLTGESGNTLRPANEFRLRDWSYLACSFPFGSEKAVGSEIEYFTTTLPSLGIQTAQISATSDALYEALEAPAFDVLHLACHAQSDHDDILHARLIVGDRMVNGNLELMQLYSRTVMNSARLKSRRPLVYLNACESARVGPSLTAWGGWPRAFLRAGAGAFVGSSWPVRDRPAALFTEAFYEALRNGKTLAEATITARRTAKEKPSDATWLAYKVYGYPNARRMP